MTETKTSPSAGAKPRIDGGGAFWDIPFGVSYDEWEARENAKKEFHAVIERVQADINAKRERADRMAYERRLTREA